MLEIKIKQNHFETTKIEMRKSTEKKEKNDIIIIDVDFLFLYFFFWDERGQETF